MAEKPKVARIAEQVEARTRFKRVSEASKLGTLTSGEEHGFFLFYNHEGRKPFHEGDVPLMLNIVHQIAKGEPYATFTIEKHPEDKSFDAQISSSGINHVSWKNLSDPELKNCLEQAFAMRGLMREKEPDSLPKKLDEALSLPLDSLKVFGDTDARTLSTKNSLVTLSEAHVTGKELDTEGQRFDIQPLEITLARLGLKGSNLNDEDMENELAAAIHFQRIVRRLE